MPFDVDLTLRRGGKTIAARFSGGEGITALFGPSGAGKTSVLDMVAGLVRPDAGRIVVGGEVLFDSAKGVNLPPERRRCGYVFQDLRLFPHRKVRDNLLFGWRLARPEARWLSLGDAVDFLGIAHLLDRAPASLSGGEAQRVAIGRALLSGPAFLAMDEPLSSLDHSRREEILRLVTRIRDELRLPILYVSHDPAEIDRLEATVIRLD
ncbi:ATP-binding cassette domain-containing protein [Novosphingobium flavum]|uniref:ATP-binding cassette domain-containing protein n=1 Tax=Novosphingobium flavum TaxID=1778672 RepID=A0A7X1KLG8_9SPHN|nr:ATP-binding cassette domain-containing protein [Novosphingobium flavum]MBC2665220.1 ATP-binding cassette domain-containing protein [Novosphingobium flavum]